MGRYTAKVNTSPKQKKLKEALEKLGHTKVEVWWKPLQPATEMCGIGGGYYFHSDQIEFEPLGLSYQEAVGSLENPWIKRAGG